MPERMRAVVLSSPNEFALEEVPTPRPGPFQVLCRVRAVSICGTDPHIIRGDYPGFWPKAFPLIPGHEWAGEVVALGEGCAALGWEVGDRVAGTSHAPCGFCRMCVTGRYNLCENYGREGLHAQYGHNADGAYADYVVHSIRSVFRIPPELSWDHACMLDPASIALHTVNRARLAPGDIVAVIGPGVQGLLAAECARATGAGRVIVVGRGERLRVAERLGYETVDSRAGDPVARVRDLTGGRGADAAIECAGTPATIRQAVEMVRRGGRVSVIGIPLEDAALPFQRIVLDEIDIAGVRAAAGEMTQVIPLVADGRLRLDELITH
ncbi:MAG: alcohol dehydrogenase catalytic domain-containing protein, partial [Thermomicrobiaceae bacterium]|nr:alcohol dehydrogenase catalytic domain-containing protein [Thermomicrobiaceae bacterium]